MKATLEELRALLRLVGVTSPQEINCEEFLSLVSAYLEHLLHSGLEPTAEYAPVVQHLQICPECLQEFEALFAALRSEIDSPFER